MMTLRKRQTIKLFTNFFTDNKRRLVALLTTFTVVVGVYNSWFLSYGARTSGDWGFLLPATADTLRRHYFSIWLSDTQFGRVLIDAGQAPSYAIYGFLSKYFGIDYALAERLVHLWPAVLFAIVCSYLLVLYLYRDRMTAVLGAIVYSANTYYLALLTGGLTLVVAYALAPLVLLLYVKSVRDSNYAFSIWCGLLLAVCGAYEPRITMIIIVALGLYAIIHYFESGNKIKNFISKDTASKIVLYGLPVLIYGLLNIYWVIALSRAGGPDSSVISNELFGNEFFNTSAAMTLFHPFWTGGRIEPFFAHDVPLYFWLVPLIAVAGLILSRKRPIVLYFALIGSIGILLTKQSSEPFSSLYHWLFVNLPGFNAYREASKFYILIAISYCVLVPGLFFYVKKRFQFDEKFKYAHYVVFVITALLFLPNLVPIANRSIETTFSEKRMPASYSQVNEIVNERDYSRVLWLPQRSRWSFMSDNHPAVNASTLLTTINKDIVGSYEANNNATRTDEILSMMQQEYMPQVLSNASIKYVVVPMQDIENDDNFYRSYNDDPQIFIRALDKLPYLKRVRTDVDGFAIYQSKSEPKKYFSTTDNVYAINSPKFLSDTIAAIERLRDTSDIVFSVTEKAQDFMSMVNDAYAGYTAENLRTGSIHANRPSASSVLYTQKDYATSKYSVENNSLIISKTTSAMPEALRLNTPANESLPLNPKKEYVAETDNTVHHIDKSGRTNNLGAPLHDMSLSSIESGNLLTSNDNLFVTEPRLDDCAVYGVEKKTSARNVSSDEYASRVLEMYTSSRKACVSSDEIDVQPGKFLFGFKYKGASSQLLSYSVTFSGGKTETDTIDLTVVDGNWHKVEKVLSAPSWAKKMRVTLITRPSNQLKVSAINSFTDLSLRRLDGAGVMSVGTGEISKQPMQIEGSDLSIKNLEYKNVIPNGNFEKGLWKSKVGDCNAYDDFPQLSMSIKRIEGMDDNALELGAKRHTACTDTGALQIKGGKSYLFSMKYQSNDANTARYVITMDDSHSTTITDEISITDKNVGSYSKVIKIPTDASKVSVALFSDSKESGLRYTHNRYDDVSLIEVPDVDNRFYVSAKPKVDMQNPRGVTDNRKSSTYKDVKIQGAKAPFVLLMSEQYHPGWKLVHDNAFSERSAATINPFKSISKIADAQHFRSNAFQNAWYVDPLQLCKDNPKSCSKNSDGTYDISLATYFEPQRWFNLGLVISGCSLVACLMAGVILTVRNSKERNRAKSYVSKK